ncbi:TonB-dependent receptor plug domain-containing protein [Nonlabens sp. SY33080]|uniref:TonB-dependent receptor plug domain-containing protein n=1 Tax=Nonlabens sp. SY33080 TaxID=2719911 RepID=UPI001428D86E|nr:TonB-dependent receptor [Nonlabens sp. SY33080]
MKFKFNVLIVLILAFAKANSQQTVVIDTTEVESLDEIVVTGQYNPQSIKKSVYNVRVIKAEQIKQIAAVNVADLLNFNLNLNVTPSASTGRSTVSFFGLDARYFNVLIDNVPIVSDNGVGSNIDLTQINLDDVERIEIVEGSMGVQYGANAVSGVLNIITKKSDKNKWRINLSLQEETVSDEYAWFDEGRHVQGATISHNINDNWYASVGVTRNDFAGFFNNKKGRDYFENDGLRGYEWLPKEQITSNALLGYNNRKHKFFYKFEYFDETINFFNSTVRSNFNSQNSTINPSATDRIYKTSRIFNHLNGSGTFDSGLRYSVSLSYQEQKRRLNEFNYFILSRERTAEIDEVNQSGKFLYSKGTLGNLFKTDRFNAQVGYEITLQEGFDREAAGENILNPKTRNINDFAGFISSEIGLSDKLTIRPGIRFIYNSQFDNKAVYELTARQLFEKGFELRANVGTSYRVPDFTELYYYFVDANHDVQGNENLKPEEGLTTFLSLKKKTWFDNSLIRLENSVKLTYIDLSDRIELSIVNTNPLQYRYVNIDSYRFIGLTNTNSLKLKNWSTSLNATVFGISRELASEDNASDDYLYQFQLNASLNYHYPKWDAVFSLLVNYNGRQQDFRVTGSDSDGNSTFSKIETDAYSWLDASIRKSFLSDQLEATVGARNLFDITRVDTNYTSSGGAHNTATNSILLGYGRSFYLKLLYKLNF